MKNNDKHILQCDPDTGVCGIPSEKELAVVKDENGYTGTRPVKLLYFTDPICSSCWGIEPQLKKLKLEYGDHFEMEYRMGGLLKSWSSYGGSDVRNPGDVATHWDEASAFYEMPINGDVWKEDPLASSYPPSIAFKAAQLQDPVKAEKFLRRIREMVFVEKKNITYWENLLQAAQEAELEIVQFRKDYHGRAMELFNEDLEMTMKWNVRGFPTIFFIDQNGRQVKVYGSRDYVQYENALLELLPGTEKKQLPSSYDAVMNRFGTLTTKEFSLLNDKKMPEAEIILNYMASHKKVEKIGTRNGYLWRKMEA